LLERALELLSEDSPGRAAAMIELAAAGWNLLPGEEVRRLLDAGADLAAERGLRALELRARILRIGAVPDNSSEALPAQEVIAETDAALSELEALADPRALGTVLCTRANAECSLGRAADATASAQRALDVLRAADEDMVWALANLVWGLVESPMPVAEAGELLARLLDELGVRPSVRSELIVGLAELAELSGQADRAATLVETVREIERDLGRSKGFRVPELSGVMLVRAGRFEEARSPLRLAIAELERLGAEDNMNVARAWLGLAEVRHGNLEAARAVAPPPAGYEGGARAHILHAELHLAEGDAGRAVERAQAAVDVATTGDWVVLNADARLALARALRAAADPVAAARRRGRRSICPRPRDTSAGSPRLRRFWNRSRTRGDLRSGRYRWQLLALPQASSFLIAALVAAELKSAASAARDGAAFFRSYLYLASTPFSLTKSE